MAKFPKVRSLTKNQAQILLNILNKESFKLKEKSLGGLLSALERNGYILPLGKVKRRFNWEIMREFSIEEIEIIKKIANG